MESINGQIAILILFYNKLKQTAECIRSFLPSGENIYVLNNGSSSDSFALLRRQFVKIRQVHFIDAGSNLGPAGGRNFLIKHTIEPWLFFVDNDITIKAEESWKQCLESFRFENPAAEIICPRIYNVHENAYLDRIKLEIQNGALYLNPTTERIMNVFPEGGVIIHRNIFERYGVYDPEMFAFEGYEFSLRCIKMINGGLRVYCIDSIILMHDHRFQKKKTDKESVRVRYDSVKIKNSYNKIVETHKIVFHHDWQNWTDQQLMKMTYLNIISKIKQKFKRFLGK